MIRLRWPIVIEKKAKALQTVHCFHCGKPYFVATANLRSVNLCGQCR